MLARIAQRLLRLRATLGHNDHIFMVVVAAIIGVLGGLGAVGFRSFIDLVNGVAWHEVPVSLAYLGALPFWWKIAAPAAGGLIVGFITYYFAREAKGHGVPEVMEAVALRGGRIRPRVVIAILAASGISIGSGGSVGREGPIVQIGSALGSTLGQWLGVDRSRLRILVGCGAAAGIAGTFNAPVAGALFALEIILGEFGVIQFSPIVISSVAATVVGRYFFGDASAFEVPAYSLVSAEELFIYAILGVLAALAALAFIRCLYAAEDAFDRAPMPRVLRPAIGGAAVGVIGLVAPQIFGGGYEAIGLALHSGLAWQLMLLLVVLKIIAVSATLGSGGSGGVFAPSLFIGAMLGGAVGALANTFWPESTAGPGAYALVGMAAVVAGSTHAPLTAIIIIFELTGDYKIILPLMVSSIIATLLATRLQKASIYTLKLLRRGIDVHGGRAISVLQHIPVRDRMRPCEGSVHQADSLLTVISRFIDYPGSTLFVMDDDDRLLGIITENEIRPLMRDSASLEELVIAEDVMAERRVPKVAPGDSLADVIRLLGSHRGEVPVLEDGCLVGVIWPEDVIKSYNSEVFKQDMASGMVQAVSGEEEIKTLAPDTDTVVAEILVPRAFVGKSIRELEIRQRFGASVLLIKRGGDDHAGLISAEPGYTFQSNDVMLVLGSRKELASLRRGVPRPSS